MVARAIAQRAVQLGEEPVRLRRLDQAVPRLIAEGAGPAAVVAPEAVARGIDEVVRAGRAVARPGQLRDERGRILAAGEIRPQEDARIAGVGPTPEPAGGAVLERVRPLPGAEMRALRALEGEHEVMFRVTQLAAPDGARRRVTGAVHALVRERDLEAGELVAGDEVGDAGHRVRTVDRRRALLQHFDAVDGKRGEGVDVDEAAAEQPCRQRYLTLAVEQHQGSRRPKAPEVYVGDVLGNGRPLVVVPTVRLADDAGRSSQALHQIDRLKRALLLLHLPVQHLDGEGEVDGRFLDRRTGDDDDIVGHEVEDAVLVVLVFVVALLIFLGRGRIDRRNRARFRRRGIVLVAGSEGCSSYGYEEGYQQDQQGLGVHFASILRIPTVHERLVVRQASTYQPDRELHEGLCE